MKIRDRLTWTLSITSLVSIALLGVTVYISTAKFHEQEFFSRLEERVSITEMIFLEDDREIESAVRDRFLQTLDEEEEYAISLKPSGVDSLKNMFPASFAQLIQEKKTVQFWDGDKQGVGVHYYLPKGEYAVVVTAIDTFGQRKLSFLRRILLIGGLLAIIFLVGVDRWALSRALLPLENKIRKISTVTIDSLDKRLDVKNSKDEIGKLALAFNHVLDRLENSFDAQRQFVRNASHEIQNPLTAIRGEAEVLLQRARSASEYQDALNTILNEASRLQVLIKQLLDLEKTEALSVLPDPGVLPLDECLLESIDLFPLGRFTLNFDLEGDKEYLVYGSRPLIRTALQNLIDNALKYSEVKPVTIGISSKDGNHLIIIKDQGIGIPEDELMKISHPFYRARNARIQKGHGIGLALVFKILKLHKGNVQFKSKIGEGTQVEICFPAYTEPAFFRKSWEIA